MSTTAPLKEMTQTRLTAQVSNVRKELKGAASQVDRWLSDSTGGPARAGCSHQTHH